MEENELNLNDGGKVKGSGILKYIIIAIAVIIAIIVVVLIILLNQKTSPREIFNVAINNLREQVSILNEQVNSETIIKTSRIENNLTFNTDIEELSIFNDYKLKAIMEYDENNKYFNIITSLSNNNKRIIDAMIYIIDNAIFFESNDLLDKPIKLSEIIENTEVVETINYNISKDEYFYIFDKALEYFNDSLVDKKFTQNNEEIIIDDTKLNAIANNYLIDYESNELMTKTFKEKLINDDEFIEILSKFTNKSKEEIIDNLSKQTTFGNISENLGRTEASMIYSGINTYCATSAMENQLNGTPDICADGVTVDEVSNMIALGNAKIIKISYSDQVDELVIESNGYTYSLQEDKSFISTRNEQADSNLIITIYTDEKDNFLGFKIVYQEKIILNYTLYDNNENIEIYLDDNNTIKGTTIDGLTDISVFEKEKEVLNLNFKIDENSIDFNIDTPNAKDYLGISFKQNNEIINENEIKYDQNIIFYFGNETNPYSIELINNATIYNNTDININNTQNYVEVEQLTEDDIITILTNLQNQIEGTVFQSLFELFIKSTY